MAGETMNPAECGLKEQTKIGKEIMHVYIVEQLDDYEYGCRKVDSVWMTLESAEAYIKDKQEAVKLWDGSVLGKYNIYEYSVNV